MKPIALIIAFISMIVVSTADAHHKSSGYAITLHDDNWSISYGSPYYYSYSKPWFKHHRPHKHHHRPHKHHHHRPHHYGYWHHKKHYNRFWDDDFDDNDRWSRDIWFDDDF